MKRFIRYRYATYGRVKGVRKSDGLVLPLQDYSGFEFTAPVSETPLTYEVQLYNEVNMTVYTSFDVNVSLKHSHLKKLKKDYGLHRKDCFSLV